MSESCTRRRSFNCFSTWPLRVGDSITVKLSITRILAVPAFALTCSIASAQLVTGYANGETYAEDVNTGVSTAISAFTINIYGMAADDANQVLYGTAIGSFAPATSLYSWSYEDPGLAVEVGKLEHPSGVNN